MELYTQSNLKYSRVDQKPDRSAMLYIGTDCPTYSKHPLHLLLKYLLTQSLHYEQDVTQDQFLSREHLHLGKIKEPNLPYYLLIAERRKDEFIPFPRVLVQSETQSGLGFELELLFPFLTTVTITLNVPPKVGVIVALYATRISQSADTTH